MYTRETAIRRDCQAKRCTRLLEILLRRFFGIKLNLLFPLIQVILIIEGTANLSSVWSRWLWRGLERAVKDVLCVLFLLSSLRDVVGVTVLKGNRFSVG